MLLHCKCNFVLFFLYPPLLPIAQEALENRYQICFFMSHFLQVELLIIPIPSAISFLDWTTVWSCCLLSCSPRVFAGKLYSLHAQIEPDGGETLIARYIWGNKQLICFEFSFITRANGALLVDRSVIHRFIAYLVYIKWEDWCLIDRETNVWMFVFWSSL